MWQHHPRAVLAMPEGPEFDILVQTFEQLGIEAYRAREQAWVVDLAWRSDTIAVVIDSRGQTEEPTATLVERIRDSEKARDMPIAVIVPEGEGERFLQAGAQAIGVGPLGPGSCLRILRDLAFKSPEEEDEEAAAAAATGAQGDRVAVPIDRGLRPAESKAAAPERRQETLERLIARRLGKLKIYMGAAPGVGKTYAMLREAHDRIARGEDVVIGVVETHGRADTLAQMAGITEIPRHEVDYKGARLTEMDLDAIVGRHPGYVLVDELAHTNIPGSLNRKRCEDVELIRLAGIDVLSTLNIQHLESLNNLVERITGVKVRETVPDHVLLDATEVVLVDLPAEDLQLRLQAGKIYAPDKISQSLSNFFTTHNLTALRELALRELADRVDLRLEEVRATLGRGEEAPGIQERVLACVAAKQGAERLIRRAARLASRLNAELTVMHVESSPRSADEQRILRQCRQLGESLEARWVGVKSPFVSSAIAKHAMESQCTLIVVGEQRRSRWRALVRTPFLDEILDQTTNIDVVIVAVNEAD